MKQNKTKEKNKKIQGKIKKGVRRKKGKALYEES